MASPVCIHIIEPNFVVQFYYIKLTIIMLHFERKIKKIKLTLYAQLRPLTVLEVSATFTGLGDVL